MTYTAEEKKQIEDVLAAFSRYIREHDYFDIVYSEKIGYLKITIEEDEEEGSYIRLGSLDALLCALYHEICNDVREECGTLWRQDASLRPEELDMVRQRIEQLLEHMTGGKDDCLDYLDQFLDELE